MPTKKSGKRPVKAAAKKSGKAVRLVLSTADHERLNQAAKLRGLSHASYARQAVLAAIRADGK
jgi:hypothetical protein